MNAQRPSAASSAFILSALLCWAFLGSGCALRRSADSGTSTGLPYRPEPPASAPARPGRGGYERTLPDGRSYVVSATDWRTGASSWLGTPYRWGGETREGADCSGFAKSLYREVVGIDIPRTTSTQWAGGGAVDVDSIRPGDLIFFDTSASSGGVNHVGVAMGGGEFVHASTSRGVRFENFTRGYWQKRFAGARRFLP